MSGLTSRRRDSAAGDREWRAEIIFLSESFRCMVSGRSGQIALRLTCVARPDHVILLDPAIVVGVINSGLSALEAGVDAVTEGPLERGDG